MKKNDEDLSELELLNGGAQFDRGGEFLECKASVDHSGGREIDGGKRPRSVHCGGYLAEVCYSQRR